MRVVRALAAIVSGTGALVAMASGPALANPVIVAPATVKLGGTLTVQANGCSGGTFWLGGGESGETPARGTLTYAGEGFSKGTLTVPRSVPKWHGDHLNPGPSTVWVRCTGPESRTSKAITILPAGAAGTGGGATSQGIDVRLAAGGAGALAVAGAGVVVLLRRRRPASPSA
ncbi:hypothetical protein [Longispora albida]|uniref:hypothetical protein n=1 Tax=Longispora albida TaxID=203523 RepID=UPI000370EFD8|nr:hypothetical protein [Longispora albida]